MIFLAKCRCRIFVSSLALLTGLAWLESAYAADRTPPGVSVQLQEGSPLSLKVTLISAADKPVRVSRDRLPWGTHESMVVVAALGGGRCLRRFLPIEDAPFNKIVVGPATPLSGSIDLERLFPNLRDALKESDVQLFWAYQAPEALKIPTWSGGWILINKQN